VEDVGARALRRLKDLGPTVGLVVLLLVSISLMGDATEDSARFGEQYWWLLGANALGLVALGGLIFYNLLRLVHQVRDGRAGARLTARLVIVFAILAVTPVVVVYHFSLKFLHEGIDSWFDLRIETALDDALELGRTALGIRMREHLKQTQLLAAELAELRGPGIPTAVDNARRLSGATELTLLGPRGQILATSSDEPTSVVPNRPSETTLLQAKQAGSYIGLDPVGNEGLFIRVVVALPGFDAGDEGLLLQALFPVPERMNTLADGVETAYAKYRELAYLRTPLKASFTLTLSLVLMLTLLTALWAAFFSARRMVAPLRDLAEGTRAVADGDLETRVPRAGDDELGFLLESFNDMTRRLKLSRDETRTSQREVEAQRAYLEAVLARLSTGVMTLDEEGRVFTCNTAAADILAVSRDTLVGRPLGEAAERTPALAPFVEAAQSAVRDSESRHELSLERGRSPRILTLSGAPLQSSAGHVLVFDDITTLVQAQREAAWSEVARRLAHEIKNPLTPIQLSAERVRHKYLARMEGDERETLDRLTRTIVHQVEAMKSMVNAFSEYARSPRMQARPLDLNDLVRDVAELYKDDAGAERIEVLAGEPLARVAADPDRLRQVLHNLIKNALEADSGTRVSVRTATSADGTAVELEVRDNGPGFPQELVPRIFEPYVTSKARGSGLGLAIVKKIAEEHGGSVSAGNVPDGGARVVVSLPAIPASVHPPKQREAV
jgi:nitrogen fixation/metabolism regulation signal transduction histidine kinase